ncbi:hypothetical protein Hanom_Chr07g00645111 [Helianthus anomalus]
MALDVAQDNYVEVQSVVEPLVKTSEWLQQYGIVNVANAVLNFLELDQTVVVLTFVARQVGHHEGYNECAFHVRETMQANWDNNHYSVDAKAEKVYAGQQEKYNNLALTIMDLVSEALQLDDYVACLKAIFELPET